ncbi:MULTISPECIES: hypothetical protein [Luteibacter]|nr:MULTISPECIES: hypothetical protein [unclassified Luteibacter]
MLAFVLSAGIFLFTVSCARAFVAWRAYADHRAQLVAEGWL